ncbi:MAG: hypothetical protein JRJ65_01515 [Deltaproteobacteria bacterium]|nr:hypothetical protein [Deltaproteobacteria bacterium]
MNDRSAVSGSRLVRFGGFTVQWITLFIFTEIVNGPTNGNPASAGFNLYHSPTVNREPLNHEPV